MKKKWFFLKVILALFLIFGGVQHFTSPNNYIAFVPSFLPFTLVIIYVSGLFEILFGLALFFKKLEIIGAWGILILMLLPIINTSEIRSSKFRPIYGIMYWFLVSDFLILGWIGQKPVETPYVEVGQVATVFYFLFFLVLVPVIGIIEKSLIRAKV